MNLKNLFARLVSLTTVIALLATPTTAFAASYNDYDDIVNTGVVLPVTQKLVITSPAKNLKTTASAYFISGTSNPKQKTYINGQEITSVGIYGSFGIYVGLELGANTFTVTNGDSSKSVTITRVANSSQLDVYTTNTMTAMYPSFHNVAKVGSTVTLQCTAPAGAVVTATVDGLSVRLQQVVPGASTGVAAVFKAPITIPTSYPEGQTTNIGKVTYSMNYGGKTTNYTSGGNMYVTGANANMIVTAQESATMTYKDSSTSSGFFSPLRVGSTDRVVEQTADMYKLGFGAWVQKGLVAPVEGNGSYKNKVTQIDFVSDTKGESYIFKGTAQPTFKAGMDDTKLVVELYNTTGIGEIFAEDRKSVV